MLDRSFVTVCGDGEYIIYTALAWRNKSFGSGVGFAWAADSNTYAVREAGPNVRVYRNFKERAGLVKIGYTTDGLYGGTLLGVKGMGFVVFYDWETGAIVRRIDVEARNVRSLLDSRCLACLELRQHADLCLRIVYFVGLLVWHWESRCHRWRRFLLRAPIRPRCLHLLH